MSSQSSNFIEDGGNNLVRVRAQVMTRDDSAGGWVAMGGGGLSNVSVIKVELSPNDIQDDKLSPLSTANKFEFIIYGKRISDQSVVLSCKITRDFTYYKVMPTFHHWQTGDKKFGLTFQAAADARAFDQGVRSALQEYLHVHPKLDIWDDREKACYGFCVEEEVEQEEINLGEPPYVEDLDKQNDDNLGITLPTFKPPIPTPVESPGDEDDVFMTLELPSKNNSSHSSSQESAKTDPLSNSSIHSLHASLYRTCLPPHTIITSAHHKPVERSMTEPSSYIPQKALPLLDTGQFSKELLSRGLGVGVGVGGGDISISDHSLKKPSGNNLSGGGMTTGVSRVGVSVVGRGGDELKKTSGVETSRICKYCQEQFSETDNPRGACRFGPDPRGAIFETLQCIPCAHYVQEKCDSRRSESRRNLWLTLSFLFRYVVPILCCCCGLLKNCHEPCVQCGICGAKHCAQDL